MAKEVGVAQLHFGATTRKSEEEEEEEKRCYQGYKQIISTLPEAKKDYWGVLNLYKGFWLNSDYGLQGIMWMEQHFKARDSDTLLITPPKCGTTWLKALAFAILNRSRFPDDNNHPLLHTNPHICVPSIELTLCRSPPITDPETLASPRLLTTHCPLSVLPGCVLNSGCRMVYLCRDPKDMFVSMYHFITTLSEDPQQLPIEDIFEGFCSGISSFGPFWDHVLEYWKMANLEPNKVLFLKYEDLKSDPLHHTKELAKFLGQPFSREEEEKGEVHKIVELCSFEKMSNLEVNKSGVNRLWYRKGEVGDWKNHLTLDMKNRLQIICQQKFAPSQLKLGYD